MNPELSFEKHDLSEIHRGYQLKLDDQIVGEASVTLLREGTTFRAMFDTQYISQEYRGGKPSIARKLDSYVLTDLHTYGVSSVYGYVPRCFTLIPDGKNFKCDYLWVPPIYEEAGEVIGGFRTAKILLTPHLEDGTPLHSEVNRTEIISSKEGLLVNLDIIIDLNDKSESSWEVVDQVEILCRAEYLRSYGLRD